MLRRTLSLVLLVSLLPSAQAEDPKSVAQQSAVVIVLCEDGGRTPAGRAMESFGRLALAPLVRRAYNQRTWLVGKRATPKAFLAAIREAAGTHRAVDVILFAHGTPNKTHLAGGTLTGKQLVRGLKGRGGDRIRMVYTTTCYSKTVLDSWRQSGAWAVRGMRGVNRPLDFPRFLLGWLGGEDYGTANEAGFKLNERLHKAYNEYGPLLKLQLANLRRILEYIEPGTEEGKQLKQGLLDALRVMSRWFRKPRWDIEDSRPQILGPKARIDRLPGDGAQARRPR